MTKAGLMSRSMYVRITNEEGKREYVKVGYIFISGKVLIWEGMPNPGWFK